MYGRSKPKNTVNVIFSERFHDSVSVRVGKRCFECSRAAIFRVLRYTSKKEIDIRVQRRTVKLPNTRIFAVQKTGISRALIHLCKTVPRNHSGNTGNKGKGERTNRGSARSKLARRSRLVPLFIFIFFLVVLFSTNEHIWFSFE